MAIAYQFPAQALPKEKDHRHLSSRELRELICGLCRHFYHQGWVSGTGGGISLRKGQEIYSAPSGVQKEQMNPDDIFVIHSEEGLLHRSKEESLRVSACQPLFMQAYQIRKAGAVIHSHSMNAMLVTLMQENVFRMSHLEMMKGIKNMGIFDTIEVPILENTSHESELEASFADALRAFPHSQAVLVKGHGVYVLGDNWVEAKTQAECYDYLFKAFIRIKELGIPFPMS